MMTAPVKSLAEIAEFVQYGYTASASEHPVGPRFLRITDIVPSQIDWDSVPYCEIDEKAKGKFSLATGDIVIARTGATVGYAKLIRDNPEAVFASYLVRIRVDHQLADPGYIGRIVESDVYKQFVMSRVGGAAQPNANAKVLSAFRLPIPKRSTQSRIVEILSAYDDLIENNRRRIQLLEQAARLFYKEWFVHLRFPGHEHTQIIDGVPEGWARREINDLASKIGSGATPRGGAAAYQTTGIALVRSQNIYDFQFVDNGLAYIDDLQAKKLANVTVEERDILLNITGASVGRCCMIPSRHLPARVNQHVMIIRVKPSICGQHYILHSINSHRNKEQLLNIARAGGATREALTKDVVGRLSLMIPPALLLNEFEQRATLLSDQCHLLEAQNVQLAKARNLLLPKLMNGEVAV